MAVTIDPESFEMCKELTQRNKHSMIVMKMDLQSLKVSVESKLPAGEGHDAIVETLKAINECRYVIFNFAYKTPEGADRMKAINLLWAPAAAPLKQRTVYAAFNAFVKSKLEGIALECHAGDVSELTREHIEDKCQRKFR